MTCEECKDLGSHEFRSSDDLVYAVQVAATELDRGVLRRLDLSDFTLAEQEALQSAFDAGEQPDALTYRFECTQCGDRFELAGNPEEGTGRWTRTEAAPG